jgi:lipoic acid synthetase
VIGEVEFAKQAERVCQAVEELGLRHVVLTSVTRDDLNDGGASGFVEAVSALKTSDPELTIEVLVPDFQGNQAAIAKVIAAGPDVFNHNLETVPRLYSSVRPQADYQTSLDVLKYAASRSSGLRVKTGVMLGMGETREELRSLMRDALAHGVDIFTAGQYLQPSRAHLPVARYLEPQEFFEIEADAREIGFKSVHVAPLVRSSYHASELLESEGCHD